MCPASSSRVRRRAREACRARAAADGDTRGGDVVSRGEGASGARSGASAASVTTVADVPSSSSWDAAAPAPLSSRASRARPRHRANILVGNARWARERALPVTAGHERGVDALRTATRCAAAWQVEALTVYAFSHENWRRDSSEVAYLMTLLERTLVDELGDLVRHGVRVNVMGDLGMVTSELRRAIRNAEDATRANKKLRLSVALSYGGRQDVLSATRALARECAAGHVDAEDITEEMIAERLSTRHLPSHCREPDLLIRTSGEQRLSNFMLWEMAYTELLFSTTLWPDFGEDVMRDALEQYAARARRFGTRDTHETDEKQTRA
jgi:undecaprenyl diphosphate synthase